jgi:nitroreductase
VESKPTFETIRSRSAARQFSSRKIDERLLFELLDLTNRAPSGYNLQPWNFVIVRDNELRGLLSHVAFQQRQVREAPVTVVFVADPLAWKTTYPRILDESVSAGLIEESYARISQNNVNRHFRLGPFGLYGLLKKMAEPLQRLRRPTAHQLGSRDEAIAYVNSQCMLAAATFMLAAQSVGLHTCPMEGFDPERLKRLLAIPNQMSVPIIIPLGYLAEGAQAEPSYRVPTVEKARVDLFPNKLSLLRKPK